MTDYETMKVASENTCNKIKALYPHITVSGDVDKPYYNIDWYDIEKQEMYRGYSSYNLQFVRKWLEEEFEVVEEDIDNIIKRQQAEIERYKELEEQGRLIELPCTFGDTVYFVDESEIYFDKVNNIEIRKVKGETIFCIGYMDYRKEDFGKIAFLTKAEAEAKLKELVGEANDR